MIKKINFSDVNPIRGSHILSIKRDIFKIIDKKDFILGSAVKDFEKIFSKMSKTNFSVGCASGTDALNLSLMSLNIKKDDEVIVPGLTYISTGLSVLLNNNKLVFADIDNNTGLISIDSVKKKITNKTKVVIPVNLYGQKVDLQKLRKAVGKNIYIVEDSAQSHFAFTGKNKKVTSNKIADASCYSFYPAKNLGAYGDGGLITTNNKKLYNKLLALRNLGSIKKYDHFLIGLNSRLDTIQAVVLKNKLKTILYLNQKRREIAHYYDKKLCHISEIKLTKTNEGSSRHLYVIRVRNRNKLIKHLSKKGIACIIHYPYSLNKLKAFRNRIKKVKLKNTEMWVKECLSLPIHPNMKIAQAAKVVTEIKKYFKYN
jgi:dTDP-4-amino-4,6-dideoxygalactose transaminase